MSEVEGGVTRVRVLTGATVTAEFEPCRRWGGGTVAEQVADIEAQVKEFHEFVRDHRSQDPVHLTVTRDYEEQCSACKRPWETQEEAGVTYCAWCGETVAPAPPVAVTGAVT